MCPICDIWAKKDKYHIMLSICDVYENCRSKHLPPHNLKDRKILADLISIQIHYQSVAVFLYRAFKLRSLILEYFGYGSGGNSNTS